MFKYIKWELINEAKSKAIILGIIAAIYLFVGVLPLESSDNILISFIYLAFIVILIGTSMFSFLYGAKRTMDSFKNRTFLLESMIPLSPMQILLAKYILAILFDVIFSILFVLGLSVIFAKDNVNLVVELIQGLMNADFDVKKMLFEMLFAMLSSTIAFTALTSSIFIGIKSFFPNGKGLKLISYISAMFILQTVIKTFSKIVYYDDPKIFVYCIIMLILSVSCYFISVWFIRNKLEVYN